MRFVCNKNIWQTTIGYAIIGSIIACFISAWLPLFCSPFNYVLTDSAFHRKISSELFANFAITETFGVTGVVVDGVSVNAAPINMNPETLRWSELANDPLPSVDDPMNLVGYWEFASGWPFRCFWAARTIHNNGEHSSNGICIGESAANKAIIGQETWRFFAAHNYFGKSASYLEIDGMGCTLPIRPLWLGVLGNCAIYVGAAELTLFVFYASRRSLRRNRGACEHCRYDIRGLERGLCPECGAPVK